MAHWKLSPEQIRSISQQDLDLMELSYFLYEKKLSETADNLLGGLLGASWDAGSLLGENSVNKKPSELISWRLREPREKVYIPVTLALTQNPKFMDQLKASASKVRGASRKDGSVLNVPTNLSKQKTEIVDLSTAPREEFLKWASIAQQFK